MTIKLIVAGTRTFTDYQYVKDKIEDLLKSKSLSNKEIEIITGGARGVDTLAERWARENNVKCTVVKADWGIYGKSAGPRRNQVMTEIGDILLAFWDGKSRGTKDMIAKAKGKKIDIYIRYINL